MVWRWLGQLWRLFFASTRRLVLFPNGAVPITVVGTAGAWGAWAGAGTQLAATVGNQRVFIYQIDLSNPTAPADFEVQIGYGLAAAETWLGAVTMNIASVPLPAPIEIPAGQRLAARCRDSIGGNTVDVKVLAYTLD